MENRWHIFLVRVTVVWRTVFTFSSYSPLYSHLIVQEKLFHWSWKCWVHYSLRLFKCVWTLLWISFSTVSCLSYWICVNNQTWNVPFLALDSLCDLLPGELCAHICVAIPGSYHCLCREGFTLMADGKSCQHDDLPNRYSSNVLFLCWQNQERWCE